MKYQKLRKVMRNLKAKKPNKIQILGGMPTLKRKWQSQSQNKKKGASPK